MKAAIVYYSMSGNTEYAAKKIAEKTGAELIKIEPEKKYPDKGALKFLWGGKSVIMGEKPKLKPYSFDADKYDTVIFGTPVWASSVSPPVKSFIAENRDKLKGKRFAAFFCFLGGGADKAEEKLKRLLGTEKLASSLVLIDPLNKPTEENGNKLASFCEALVK